VIVVEELGDAFLGDGDDADLDVGRVGAGEDLVVPLDLLDGEGDLLDGLELDDLGDLLGVDRGQLGEAGEGHVAGDGDDDAAAVDHVLAEELVEVDLDGLVNVDVGGGQYLFEGEDVVIG